MIATVIAWAIRLFTGALLRRVAAPPPAGQQRILIANHSSNLDFLIVWACLPASERCRLRPVAAADYWLRHPWRRWLAERIFHAVLIPRRNFTRENHPLDLMHAALDEGADLLLFPEGTRDNDGAIGPFKPGIWHLASSHPAVAVVPIRLDHCARVLPKGEFLPLPLLVGVRQGAAIPYDDDRDLYLAEARRRIEEL